MSDDLVLERLDSALLALRRFASPELARPRISHAGADIELSTMLVVDAIARSAPGEVSVGLVADLLQVAPSTASRLVERAVQAGMVAGTSSENDPRMRVLHLTREGRRLQRAALRHRTQRLADATADWSRDDLARFADLLDRFARTVHPLPSDRTDP
jgi:DNA-binding MarR family transcriptional regulator